MKFSCLQENLKHGLFVVSHLTGKNQNLPILGNVLIEVSQGEIKLVSTNLEIGVSCFVRGKVEIEGSFTVDAKILSDYINLLPNQKVDVEMVNNSLVINCGSYNTKIKGQSSEDYPLIPTVEKSNFCKISIPELKKAFNQVVFAVSTNETRAELTGVFFNFINNKELVIVATDSYRLAERKITLIESNIESSSLIVPAKTVQEVVRIMAGTKDDVGEIGEVEIYVFENQILFTHGSTEVISRLIEGQYPDYRQIIPNNHKTVAITDISQMVRAVKSSALFAKTGINDINLDFPKNNGKIVVSSASGQTGENIVEIIADVEGEDNFVVVNYRYLLDGLGNIGGEKVKICLVDGNTPCLVKSTESDDYLYVVMPIKQ